MKEGPLSKLTITKGGQRTMQYKKIYDALPVFCADKGFRYIDEILCTNKELVEATFLLTYPDATQWSSTHKVCRSCRSDPTNSWCKKSSSIEDSYDGQDYLP